MKLVTEAVTAIEKANTVYVALSGGVDSMVLLNIVSSMGNKDIVCLHVNHGISDNAESWEHFCKEKCDKLGVKLHTKHLNLRGVSNLEEAAREERYAFFSNYVSSGDVLVLGHHLDDQAETFLLRAIRGSGVDGLGCISPVREFFDGVIARPLLSVDKDDIQEYAIHNGISFVYDESNGTSDYDRNFIRNEVMPLLKSRWKNAAKSFSRVTDNCRSASKYIDSKVKCDIERHLTFNDDTGYYSLDVSEIYATKNKLERAELIRGWISFNGLSSPSKGQLESLDKAIVDVGCSRSIDCDIQMHLNKNIKVRFFDNFLYMIDTARDNNVSYKDTKKLCEHHNVKENHISTLVVSPKHKLKINGMMKTVKQVLKENRVPKFLRSNYIGMIDTKTGYILAVGSILADPQKSNDDG